MNKSPSANRAELGLLLGYTIILHQSRKYLAPVAQNIVALLTCFKKQPHFLKIRLSIEGFLLPIGYRR